MHFVWGKKSAGTVISHGSWTKLQRLCNIVPSVAVSLKTSVLEYASFWPANVIEGAAAVRCSMHERRRLACACATCMTPIANQHSRLVCRLPASSRQRALSSSSGHSLWPPASNAVFPLVQCAPLPLEASPTLLFCHTESAQPILNKHPTYEPRRSLHATFEPGVTDFRYHPTRCYRLARRSPRRYQGRP